MVFPHDILHGNCLPHPTIPHLSLPTKFICSKQSLTILEARVGRCSTRERTWAVPEAAGVPWEEGSLKRKLQTKLSSTSPGRADSATFANHGRVTATDTFRVCSCSPYRCQTSLTSAFLRGNKFFIVPFLCFCTRVTFHPGSPGYQYYELQGEHCQGAAMG